MSVFSPLSHSFLGFDPFFDEVDRLLALSKTQATGGGWPPLNLYKEADDGYSIELAVAGYKRDDLKIEHDKKNGILTITGDNRPRATAQVVSSQPTSESTELAAPTATAVVPRAVVRQGIAGRNFSRAFTVADDLIVEGATLEDGMLTIKLKKLDLPENKPLQIAIG